jgi:hypothetical protein
LTQLTRKLNTNEEESVGSRRTTLLSKTIVILMRYLKMDEEVLKHTRRRR